MYAKKCFHIIEPSELLSREDSWLKRKIQLKEERDSNPRSSRMYVMHTATNAILQNSTLDSYRFPFFYLHARGRVYSNVQGFEPCPPPCLPGWLLVLIGRYATTTSNIHQYRQILTVTLEMHPYSYSWRNTFCTITKCFSLTNLC